MANGFDEPAIKRLTWLGALVEKPAPQTSHFACYYKHPSLEQKFLPHFWHHLLEQFHFLQIKGSNSRETEFIILMTMCWWCKENQNDCKAAKPKPTQRPRDAAARSANLKAIKWVVFAKGQDGGLGESFQRCQLATDSGSDAVIIEDFTPRSSMWDSDKSKRRKCAWCDLSCAMLASNLIVVAYLHHQQSVAQSWTIQHTNILLIAPKRHDWVCDFSIRSLPHHKRSWRRCWCRRRCWGRWRSGWCCWLSRWCGWLSRWFLIHVDSSAAAATGSFTSTISGWLRSRLHQAKSS